ncbi:MAG: 3'-5' exonuclease [Bacteroidia bacterium]|jgi:DNA polymerase elongation subunit (family B)|nr:3'-5' exonuclease [Bacteroidia bacterium]
MLEQLDITKILVLDIETVPQYPSFNQVPERWKALWEKKSNTIKRESELTVEELYPRAGIYAEFGKIVCISVGYFNNSGQSYQFRVKSFYSHNESEMLNDFCKMVTKHFNSSDDLLCAHNGKEFDFPYIARRCVINKIPLPEMLNTAGKKPWEIKHLDTMELWKFGDYKSFTSLDLLAASFNIATPKDDIDGSQVWKVYWEENNIERIQLYCQKDVITVAQLLLSFRGENLLSDEDIIAV